MPDATTTLSAGERIGIYQILGLAGAGGMGVVYKALDLRLQRTVALKFLPHELIAGEKERERFLKEARTASSLDHPNIGIIHGVEDTSDGRSFIVMAFYEGETLSQKIRRGPLPASDAIELAIQMARGLSEAHARHVVHRDIKPSNVIITNQSVAKIVDFGLASVVSTATATQSIGTTGTVGYMSPEQTLGKSVYQRTDIWALGVVIAEMLTCRNPFHRDTIPSIILAILNQPPDPLDGAPPKLQEIIYHALAKDPATRYQSCKEMLADLESVRNQIGAEPAPVDGAAPTRSIRSGQFQKYVEDASKSAWFPAASRKQSWTWRLGGAAMVALLLAALSFVPFVRDRVRSLFAANEDHIAVLPFENVGNNPANEALSEGLMNSLTSRLSNLDVGKQSLWVVPASEVRRHKVADPAAALRELGATVVVQGSMQRDNQGIHLTINLVNTKNLRQIGSVALEDRAGDFSAIEDEAVSRLARLMRIQVTPDMLRATGGSVTPAAYESYLKALGYMQRYDKAGNLDSAISALEAAAKTDPRFALAFAGLGEAYRLKYQVDRNPKWLDEASANCQRAVELDDHLPAAYVTLGFIHDGTGKHDLAVQEFQHALDLNPRDAVALAGTASAYERAGRFADAESAFKRAAALRPDYWDGYNSLGAFYERQQRPEEALVQFRRVLDLTPDNSQAYINLGVVFLDLKKTLDAEKAFRKSIELNPSYAAYANLGFLYISQGRYPEATSMTEKALQLNDKDFRLWANLGLAYRWLKQDDKAHDATQEEQRRLEEAIKVDASNPTVQSALGLVYAQLKMRDESIPRLEAALALAPDDPDVLVDVGQAYEDFGDRRQALVHVEKALTKGASLDDLKRDPELQNLLSDPNFRPQVK